VIAAPSTDKCVHQTALGLVVEGGAEKDSATEIVPLTFCPLTGETNETTGPGVAVGVAVGVGLCLFETLTFSETVRSSWLDDEYAWAEMVCAPFGTAVESHTYSVDEDDDITVPSTRNVTCATFGLIVTDVVTKAETVASGAGEAMCIGLAARAWPWPNSAKIKPSVTTVASLPRPDSVLIPMADICHRDRSTIQKAPPSG
jgi:hypothetical protein